VELARESEEAIMKYSMREETARLADGLIRRYGLDVGRIEGGGR
jgi:hypothetical protein